MKQWLYTTMLVFILLGFLPYDVQASPNEEVEQEATSTEIVNNNLEQVNINELKVFWDNIMVEYGEFLPEAQKGSLMEFIQGDKEFSFSGYLNVILFSSFLPSLLSI